MEAKIDDCKMNLNVNITDKELFTLMIDTHENVENAINKYGEFKQLIKDFNTIGDDMYKYLKEKYGQKITLVIDPDDAIEDDCIKCCICGGEFHRLSEQHMQEKHGISLETYREICEYEQDLPLVCNKENKNNEEN